MITLSRYMSFGNDFCYPLASCPHGAIRSINRINSTLFKKVKQNDFGEPNGIEFLFRVLLGIGVLFRVGTPYSSIPLRITLRSCRGKMQKHGSACLLRITMSLQIMSLEKFIPKGRIEHFYSV